uniref:Nuclear receptor domain-containing protein n=1 Tax=Panagrolaimus sp. PS1159 TaxID=55785 RepID=A0AC35ER90_9BILA
METCPICSCDHRGNKKRYGVYCCSGCASFFRRTVSLKRDYGCSNGNECFKKSLSKGINCLKCRYEKCLEIGMLSFEVFEDAKIKKQNDVQKSLNTETFPSNQSTDLNPPTPINLVKQNKIWAERLECVLETVMDYPKLIESYFSGKVIDLLKLPSEIQFSTSATAAIEYFSLLFEKYPIKSIEELRLLSIICICKFEFKWLSETAQLKIKEKQKQGFENIKINNLETTRFNELIFLSTHALNIFYALL